MNNQAISSIINPKQPLPVGEQKLVARLLAQQDLSFDELSHSTAFVKSAEKGITIVPSAITTSTRINEQQLNAAITYSLIKLLQPRQIQIFKQNFLEKLNQTQTDKSTHGTLRATRYALRALIEQSALPKSVARVIRRIALGKAQLDDVRNSLLTARIPGAKETPLRSLKTAYSKLLENNPFNRKEHLEHQIFVKRVLHGIKSLAKLRTTAF